MDSDGYIIICGGGAKPEDTHLLSKVRAVDDEIFAYLEKQERKRFRDVKDAGRRALSFHCRLATSRRGGDGSLFSAIATPTNPRRDLSSPSGSTGDRLVPPPVDKAGCRFWCPWACIRQDLVSPAVVIVQRRANVGARSIEGMSHPSAFGLSHRHFSEGETMHAGCYAEPRS
jgi:hypothetical protein